MTTTTIPALQTSPPDVAGLASFLKDRFDDLTQDQAEEVLACVGTLPYDDLVSMLIVIAPYVGDSFVQVRGFNHPEKDGNWEEWKQARAPSIRVMATIQKRIVKLVEENPSACGVPTDPPELDEDGSPPERIL